MKLFWSQLIEQFLHGFYYNIELAGKSTSSIDIVTVMIYTFTNLLLNYFFQKKSVSLIDW